MFGFTHNERWLTSSLSHTHSRILHRSSMKLYLFSLSTGWQCMEVRLPCALCEMEQSLATSDHTVITPTPPFLAFTTTADFICLCRSRLITAPLRNRFFRAKQQTHVLFVYLAVFLYTKGFAWNVNFLFLHHSLALPCLPAPLSLCGPLGNIVSFLRACSQCSHGRLNCSFIQMNEALFCLENQTQTVHVRARRMSVENRGL